MEGRAPPPDPDADNDDVPLSVREHETYVIQIPKDQIYRVPPPENAIKAEHFRKPETNQDSPPKPCAPRCGWVLCMGIALAIVSVAFVVAILSLYFVLNIDSPNFSVVRLVVVDSKKVNPKSPSAFEIYLKADNENSRTGIYYEENGSAALFLKKESIGQCQFPTLHQVEKSSTNVRLLVHGNGKALNLNKTKPGSVVPLDLQMKVPVTMNIGYLKIWRNEILIECKIEVSLSIKRGASSKIISQKCETQFNP